MSRLHASRNRKQRLKNDNSLFTVESMRRLNLRADVLQNECNEEYEVPYSIISSFLAWGPCVWNRAANTPTCPVQGEWRPERLPPLA